MHDLIILYKEPTQKYVQSTSTVPHHVAVFLQVFLELFISASGCLASARILPAWLETMPESRWTNCNVRHKQSKRAGDNWQSIQRHGQRRRVTPKPKPKCRLIKDALRPVSTSMPIDNDCDAGKKRERDWKLRENQRQWQVATRWKFKKMQRQFDTYLW